MDGGAASGQPGSVVRAVAPYSLPKDLAVHVSHVDKVLRLPLLSKQLEQNIQNLRAENETEKIDNDPFMSCAVGACSGATTPAVLRARYGLPANKTRFTPGNSMAVTEFQLQVLNDQPIIMFVSHVVFRFTTSLFLGNQTRRPRRIWR